MDPLGIEPRFSPCKGDVLPLSPWARCFPVFSNYHHGRHRSTPLDSNQLVLISSQTEKEIAEENEYAHLESNQDLRLIRPTFYH